MDNTHEIFALHQRLFCYYTDKLMPVFGNPKSPFYDPLTNAEYFNQQFMKLIPVVTNFATDTDFMVFGEPMDYNTFLRFLLDEEIDWFVDCGKGWIECINSNGEINRFEQKVA